jgi:signal peptide peptidase-like 2B
VSGEHTENRQKTALVFGTFPSFVMMMRPSPIVGCVALLVASLAPSSYVGAVMQSLAIDVSIGGNLSYSMLASAATFGSYPKMGASRNPSFQLTVPPESDPYLCNNFTGTSALPRNGGSQPTIMLVPRGNCPFIAKTLHAQTHYGASAVLVYGTLESRYTLNATNGTATESDVIYPLQFHDYDCSKGQAFIPASLLSFEELPYDQKHNDAVLSPWPSSKSGNQCMHLSPDKLASCQSKACLLTGERKDEGGHREYRACCAWDLSMYMYGNPADYPGTNVTIPTAYLTMAQGQKLLQDLSAAQGKKISIVLYDRERPSTNMSSLTIWALGVFVCALAAYLSAEDYQHLYRKKLKTIRSVSLDADSANRQQRSDGLRADAGRPEVNRQEESLELTAEHAIFFIILASTSLLVLFVFKVYAVVKYFYAFGCSNAVAQVVFEPLLQFSMKKMGLRDAVVYRTNTEDFGDITCRNVVSTGLGLSMGVSWLYIAATVPHPDSITFFWITQDLFGACMCILFAKTIKLNSIRVAAILLIVAFFYDIFFVFVTPLLTGGKSIMITVATSGGPPSADPLWCEKYPHDKACAGGDPLPMLLAIPRIGDYQGGASLLGLGDIVLPGLLLSFGARLDAAKALLGVLNGSGAGSIAGPSNSCKCWYDGYYPPLVVAYAIGLLMANAAVYIMRMGQPALLYLVPCCLGTIVYMGWRRNELQDLWDGPRCIRAADNHIYGLAEGGGASDRGGGGGHVPLPSTEDEVDLDYPTVPSAVDDLPSRHDHLVLEVPACSPDS